MGRGFLNFLKKRGFTYQGVFRYDNSMEKICFVKEAENRKYFALCWRDFLEDLTIFVVEGDSVSMATFWTNARETSASVRRCSLQGNLDIEKDREYLAFETHYIDNYGWLEEYPCYKGVANYYLKLYKKLVKGDIEIVEWESPYKVEKIVI